MIPHRPKRQDVAIPFQGNNRKTDPPVTADQAVHMAANQPPVIISDHSAPLVLSADTPIYSLIATVVAEDPDGNDNQLTYRIIAGNADNQFYIADNAISVTGRGRDIYLFPNALNINAASRHVLTIEVSDGVNTVTTNITIDIDTATADIGITANAGADLTALEAGDVITGSIMTADPDGVAPNTDITWRWFHHGNPAVTIATGTSYAITSFDWGKQIGLELIYVDTKDVATQTQSHSFALTEPVTRPENSLTTTAPLRGDDTDILADYLLGWQPFAKPDSGAVTITWKLDKISLAADIVRPLLEQAFASFAKYININFVETQDYSANILLNFLPSSLNPRVGGIAEAEGNHRVLSFFLDAINFTDTANHQRATSRLILHELGHALGLKHPFHAAPEKYKQGDDLWPYHAPFISNTHTIMSYDSSGEKDIFETLKSADIIALQRLYGKAPNTDTIDENRNNVFTAITFDITGLDISSLTWDITGQGADQFLVERHADAYTLKIIQSLDYEMVTRYDLIVTATDRNANQVEQAVSIIVADKNDNTPYLAFHDASSVTGRIVESTRQTGVIFTVSNLDSADIITWSISGNGADNFILERDGVLYRLVLKPDAVLDINAVHDYDLTVTVTDGQFISRPVAVRVTNQNIAPHFTSDHSAPVMLAENSRGGTLVVKVTATDPENAILIYRIISGNNNFIGTGRSDGYDIRVHPDAELDFEIAETHILTVEVSDGVNKVTTTITIQVTNLDEGDAVIDIIGATGVDLANLDVGDMLIASVTTPDPDGIAPNTQPTWRWYHVDQPAITIGTGDTYTIQSSDRRKIIAVEYTYIDGVDATHHDTTTISAALETVVPPEPFFLFVNRSTSFLNPDEVKENVAGTFFGLTFIPKTRDGTVITDLSDITLTITSTDPVDTAKGFIIFRQISPTTSISLRTSFRPLDYEALQGAPVNLIITATRHGVSATAMVQVHIIDVNDNAPVLTASGTGMVSENISGVLTGITFNISDADTDAVNRFLWHHFTITSDVTTDPNNSLGSQFEIRAIDDIWSLKLKKTASLDYETLPNSGVITLQVTVSDGLNISAPVTVQVQVNDVNGPPVFLSDSFAVTVDHMAEYGAMIYRLPILYDEDHSLTYRITAGNTGNIFAIDHMGKITLAASLDKVAIDSVYQLTVSVSDGQGSMDTATIDIRVIKVLDMVTIWENHPLSKPAAVISLPADLTGATMRLVDDQPDNAFFRIDDDGQIWWLATPDFEMPKDADADNIYMAEIIFTKNGVDSRGFVNIQVGDIGPGRSVYDPITRPDGDGRVHAVLRSDGEPGGLANYLLGYDAYTHPVNHPATEPLILTWAMNENIYPAHITRPWMHWAFSAFEAAINIRFIEVEYHTDIDMRPDLEINFIEEPGGGSALVHGDNRKIYLHRRQNPQGEFSPVLVGDQHKTLLHEIGHALGLKHPFDALSGKDWPAADATRFNPDTIMSYYISLERGLRHLELADVAALQFLYGAPEYQGTITENHIGVETGITFNLTADILSSATWAIAGTDANRFEVVWGQTNWILKLKSGHSLDFETGDTRILTITLINDDYDFVGIRAMITVMDVDDLYVPMKARDNDITLTDTATEVDAGDGSDTITGGAGNDQITGGKGDDQIDLGADNTDTDTVIYGIGDRAAKDGADTVTNFNRGVDQFVFALENNADTAGITNYDSFLQFITKGTDTLDDDEFMVQLDLGTDANSNTQLEGLFFHFAGSSGFSGGRVSLPLMKISFAEPVDMAGITAILTDDAGQPVNPGQVVNPYLFVTDLDYLDDFLGGADSINFNITAEVI